MFTLRLAIFLIFFISIGWSKENTTDENRRSTDTCGDPCLSDTFVQGFGPSQTAHLLSMRFAFVVTATAGQDWQIQGEIFRAWQTQQPGTVPIYRLFNPTTNDFISLISVDGITPPSASGFQLREIFAYVYPTQVCGSVPLFSLFQVVVGDHWYTTVASERIALLNTGWLDAGTAAFVLPI